jgi:ATPase subunit of ABC transporter with duplicated ATPase domains
LDEPSNYLEEPALLRLAQALQAYRGCVVMVSHDRWLLDQVCTDIWALAQGQWRAWPGNYSIYAQAVAAEHQDRVRQKVRLEKEIIHLEGVARSYEGWGNAREKGKTAAADSGFEGARAARLQKRALVARRRVEDRIERLQAAKPWIEKEYASAFAAVQVPDGTCLTVSELQLPGLAPFSFQIAWGSRWHIRGSNGSGKTTLLRTLLGELPLPGEIYWGKPRKIGYLPQRLPLCRERPCDLFSQAQWEQARTLLGTFKVSGETFVRPMPQLSEGQQRKVHLVRLILASPNILILDEPTTHLDMPTLEKLTDMLSQFQGTLLLVTHDAFLAEALEAEELCLSAPDAV